MPNNWKEEFDKELCEPDDADIDGELIFKENDPELVKAFIQSKFSELIDEIKNELPPLTIIHGQQRVINRSKLIKKLDQLKKEWLN